MENIDLKGVSTSTLLAIRKLLEVGVPASAENKTEAAQPKAYLCHKSPPAGYPKDKSEYGDSACYRYPLNTKARCLAAWRYVHQKDNKAILGDKAGSVISKIKNYAKEHYNLDLQSGESETIDWAQVFNEYYDAETMGERCESIVLQPEDGKENEVKMNNEEKDIKITSLEAEITKKTAELADKSSQVDTLTAENNSLKAEREVLSKFKTDTENATARANKIKDVKSKLVEAGIEADVDAEADYWLGMSDDTLTKTIAKLSELVKKGTQASASKKDEIIVPPVVIPPTDARATVAEALKEHKQAKNKK